MNCLNENNIQKIVDNECSENEYNLFTNHMKTCAQCKTQFEAQKALSKTVRDKINALVDKEIVVPEFTIPGNKDQSKIPIRRRIVVRFAAASVLLITVLSIGVLHTTKTDDSTLYYNLEYEIDANKPITDQDMVMYFTDEDGNTYESVLN